MQKVVMNIQDAALSIKVYVIIMIDFSPEQVQLFSALNIMLPGIKSRENITSMP